MTKINCGMCSLLSVPMAGCMVSFGGYNGKYHNSVHVYRPEGYVIVKGMSRPSSEVGERRQPTANGKCISRFRRLYHAIQSPVGHLALAGLCNQVMLSCCTTWGEFICRGQPARPCFAAQLGVREEDKVALLWLSPVAVYSE